MLKLASWPVLCQKFKMCIELHPCLSDRQTFSQCESVRGRDRQMAMAFARARKIRLADDAAASFSWAVNIPLLCIIS